MAASQIINVIVNSKGAVTVSRELEKIGDSARETTTYLNGLRAILSAALTFSGAREIIQTVDSFTVLQNRLRQVSTEMNTVSDSWSNLLSIANNSYSSIQSTVDLYFRVAQAFQAWGRSASEAYEFTDLFQKAAILSGSSVQTTAQAVYQFSQALNKGKLDGDEFRSVLEGLPYVSRLIEKSLGVTRAELYKFSEEGKISVEEIKAAFENAASTIRNDWKNVTPTIGMALVVLNNNWTNFLGTIQTSTGAFSAIAQLILLVANNFTLLAIAMTPVVLSLTFLAGKVGLGLVVLGFRQMLDVIRLLIPAVWSLNAAMLANPYVLVATLIAGVITAIIYFRNELGLTNEVLYSVWMTATSTFSTIMSYLSPLTTSIASVVSWFIQWNTVFTAVQKLVSITRADVVEGFAAITSAVSSFVNYMTKNLQPLFVELMSLAKAYYGLILDIVDLYVDALTPAVEAVLPAFKSVWEYVRPALLMFGKLLNDIFDGWKIMANWFKTTFLPAIRDVFEGWITIIKTVLGWVRELIAALRQAIALLKQAAGIGGGGQGSGAPTANYGAQFYAGEFDSGGAFKVGGTGGGRDTTPVAFRANRGERVTVETKKQQRANDNFQTAPEVNVPVTVVNVVDPQMVAQFMSSPTGRRIIYNVVADDRDQYSRILGVY